MRDTGSGLLPVLLLAIFSLLPRTASALDLGLALPSVLRLAAGFDDDGGYDYFLDLDQALPGGQRFLFTYGTSLSVGEEGDVKPRTVAVGVSSDPLDQLTLAMRAKDWGQSGEINTRSLSGDAQLRRGKWQFGLGVHMRSIEIFLQPPLMLLGEDSVEVNSEGIDYSVGVQIGERLYAGGNYFNNNYSRDLGFLDEPFIARDIIVIDPTSSVTFSLAAGLQEEGGALHGSLFTDWGGVNLDVSQSVSAVDAAVSTIAALGLDYDFSATTTVQLSTGQQRTEDQSDLYFASGALLINW